MQANESFRKKNLPGLKEHNNKSVSVLARQVIIALLAFIILAVLFGSLIYQRYLILKHEQKKEAFVAASNARDKLKGVLSGSLSATTTLSFFIDNNGTVKNFDSIAPQILSANKNVDVLELVPGGVIEYVYPLKGNEPVVGYNILKDSARNKEAFKVVQKKELFFSGPYQLKQGGFGIVGRLPVFRNGKFWGFTAAVIKMTTLLKATGIDSTGNSGYYYQLSKINPDTKKTEFFIPHVKVPLKNYLFSIDIPDGDWTLSVEPVDLYKGLAEIYILALIGFLFSVLGAIVVFVIVKRPEKLERLVKERTSAFKASENKYRSLVERVSDAFVSLDNDWNFNYLNEKAGEIFAQKPERLIGKNIWAEFPESIDRPFYHAYYRALQTQQFQYLEEYYPVHEKWFENHIYPSKDGLTVFFKDVTEIKKALIDLKDKEEKYRSLIEQASDGIVITDLDGYIVEVNKSMVSISGYSNEEMQGNSLYKFLPAEDVALHPLRLKELMAGESLLYERKLLKKDGSVIDIEVNSKMASTQTLIGFIRDITGRKKNENILRYQARLLQSVSDAITSLDMNRCIVSWNKACEELYGFTAEEAMGKRIPELVTFEYPDTNNDEVFKQVFSEGQWKGEFNFIHPKTKTKIYLLSNISLLKTSEGDISGFIITSKNIGDWKKAEKEIKISNERFELIGKATNDAIWEWNLETNDIWANEVHQQLYGLTIADPVPNDTEWKKRLHINDRERITSLVSAALASEHNSFEAEYQLYTENKGWAYIYGSTYIERNKEGKAIRLIGNMTDITERKKAEELLQKSYEDIRQLASNLQSIREDERTNIAREIHDELGQQLTGLKMDLHWLTRKINTNDDEVKSKMQESIELINATIKSVRKISTDLRPSILDDLGLLAALEWQSEEFEKRSGTKIKFINRAGNLTVMPDVTTALFRIYQELLTNIARHAKAELVTASLYTDEDTLYFSIKDNGVGFNIDTISNKKTLGLLGIKERTLLIGGTYEIKTLPEKGTETIISVPLNFVNVSG